MHAARPWVTLSVVLLLALLTRMAIGETSGSSQEEVSGSPSSPNGLKLYAGPGLLVQSDATGLQLGLGALFPVTPQGSALVGIESGLDIINFGSNVSSPSDMSALGLPILATAMYRFSPSKGDLTVQPFIGISAGPNIHFISLGQGRANRTVAYFELLFRGGVSFEVADNIALTVEPKVGIVGSSALFVTQASVLYSL